jgi:aminomethyltransferase
MMLHEPPATVASVLAGPLQRAQQRAGAGFRTWEGRLWAEDFGDPIGEHLAVRADVGIWDISPLRKWEVRGRLAVDVIDRLFTNTVRGLPVGAIRYGVFCNEGGAIINDATVYVLAPDRVWVFTSRDGDGEYLSDAAGMAGVGVEPLTDALAAFQVQGPRSRALLAGFLPDIGNLAYFRFYATPRAIEGVDCWVSRIGYSAELGYELFCDVAAAEELWTSIVAAGARPYGFAAADTLRIEAGLLLLGADFISGRTNPYDVSLDRVIKLEKPYFVGREALRETAAAPPRRLVALTVEGGVVPSQGAAALRGGQRVGTVTSACRSPTFGRAIGLATVASACAVSGARLDVSLRADRVAATVGSAPLYDPERRRVRA